MSDQPRKTIGKLHLSDKQRAEFAKLGPTDDERASERAARQRVEDAALTDRKKSWQELNRWDEEFREALDRVWDEAVVYCGNDLQEERDAVHDAMDAMLKAVKRFERAMRAERGGGYSTADILEAKAKKQNDPRRATT